MNNLIDQIPNLDTATLREIRDYPSTPKTTQDAARQEIIARIIKGKF